MSWEFEKVAGPYRFTEGPAWDGSGMLFSDIPNNRIMRFDPETGQTTEHISNTNEANGLMFDKDGLLYACEGGGRCLSRYDRDGARSVLCDSFEGKRLNSPNDVAIDTQGRAWFTDPRYGGNRENMELDHESVFRLDPQDDGSWTVKRITFDTTRPNGLLVSPDSKTLYVAESDPGEGEKRELRAYPINDDGTVGDYEILHNFFPHRGIDGMCLDTEGNLVATAGSTRSGPGPMIYVFAPSGRVLETHPMEVDPTNCTFGDADLQTLYVTNAPGELWRARTDRKGWLIYPSANS
jgi:gluconolactonase